MVPIYLDYNASTPIDPAVAAAMRPFLDEAFGNPSSGHWASAPAKAALEKARSQVAALLRAAADEVVFTSSGSEANNLALKGHPQRRLPNTPNISFVGQVGAEILQRLDGVAASTGSACHAGRIELSPVLKAMGVLPEIGMGAIRFSLGRHTTDAEIDAVTEQLTSALPLPA